MYRDLLTLVNESGLPQSVMTGLLYALWSEILCHWNNIDKALQFVSKGVELSEHENDVANLVWIHNSFVKVLFAKGDLARAKEAILKLEKIAGKSQVPPWIATRTAAWKARIWLTEGKLDNAQQWIQEHRLDLGELRFAREPEDIAAARILVALGDLDDAIRLLDRLIEKAEAGDRTTVLIEELLILTSALQAQGDANRATETLGRALSLAEPEGYIRIFVDEGPQMARMLYERASRGMATDQVRMLLTAFPPVDREEAKRPQVEVANRDLFESLSDRELEVLRLIADGISNQQIGEKLFISLHTVKSHARNLFAKLDVHSRTAAVKKARGLGLLPPI
jgi:LuxR family maltose regulon positive regulatory protein